MLNKDICSNLLASDFYKDILNGKSSDYLIEKHILHNVPFFFKTDMELFFKIKKFISDKFEIPITNIYLVGSGQLGFSLNPENEYRNFRYEEIDENKKESDLDFAIISNKLFSQIWDELCGFRLDRIAHSKQDRDNFKKFKNYLYKGWMRPDAFPFDYSLRKEWLEFFNSLNPMVERKVTCGLFRNERSFIQNYSFAIDDLRKIINTEDKKL